MRLEAERKLAELREENNPLPYKTAEQQNKHSYKLEADMENIRKEIAQRKAQEAQGKVMDFMKEQRGETAPSNRFTGEANK